MKKLLITAGVLMSLITILGLSENAGPFLDRQLERLFDTKFLALKPQP
jgi:hypothetical protein